MQTRTRRLRGVLTPEQTLNSTPEQLTRFRELGFLPAIAGADGDDPKPHTVPVAQLVEQRERAQAAEKERDELKERIEALEAKDASEVQKLTTKLQATEKERDKLKDDIAEMGRKSEQQAKRQLIADAARDANFHDPNAAAKNLDAETFTTVTDKESAKRAVEQLAERDPWMVKPKEDKKPEPTSLEKVLENGKRVEKTDDDDEDKPKLTKADIEQMTPEQINEHWDEVQKVLSTA